MRPLPHAAPDAQDPSEDRESELEREADRLLAQSLSEGGRGPYPFYTQRWLCEMRRREEELETETTDPQTWDRQTIATLLDFIIRESPLTDAQRRLLELKRQGLNAAQIARLSHQPETTIRRRLGGALTAARRHRESAPAAGNDPALIRLTYLEQTKCSIQRRERHCRPGREACRTDGLCKRRWYLCWGSRLK